MSKSFSVFYWRFFGRAVKTAFYLCSWTFRRKQSFSSKSSEFLSSLFFEQKIVALSWTISIGLSKIEIGLYVSRGAIWNKLYFFEKLFLSKVLDSANSCLVVWKNFWCFGGNFSSRLSNYILPFQGDILRKRIFWTKMYIFKIISGRWAQRFQILGNNFSGGLSNLQSSWLVRHFDAKIFFGNLNIYSIILRLWAKKGLGEKRKKFPRACQKRNELVQWKRRREKILFQEIWFFLKSFTDCEQSIFVFFSKKIDEIVNYALCVSRRAFWAKPIPPEIYIFPAVSDIEQTEWNFKRNFSVVLSKLHPACPGDHF